MKKGSIRFVIAVCLCLTIAGVAACGQANNSTSAQNTSAGSSSSSSQTASSSGQTSMSSAASSSSSTSPSSSSTLAIGSGNITVQVSNGTGYDIIGVRVKPSSEASYSNTNSFEGFQFANKSTAELSFEGDSNATSYDVLLLTSEDSKIAVNDIDLVHLKDIAFRFEQGVGFITYTDAASGEGADNRDKALGNKNGGSSGNYDTKNQVG